MDEVGFRDLVFRAGEGFGKRAVVGEDDKPCGGAVEAACKVEFAGPWLVDEVDDGFVPSVGRGGEDTCGLVEEDDPSGVGLEDFPRDCEMIELAERDGAIGYDGEVEKHLAAINDGLRVAFAESGLLGDELRDGHGGDAQFGGDGERVQELGR